VLLVLSFLVEFDASQFVIKTKDTSSLLELRRTKTATL
jgi:hypothetical protein